jgi:hypothetical protein
MEQSSSGLTEFQQRLLRALTAGRDEFYLTGGAALVGFYGVSRRTDDIDLFTIDDEAFHATDSLIRLVCSENSWTVEPVRASPTFRRYLVRDSRNECIVDYVLEPAGVEPRTHIVSGIRMSTPEQILANKLGAIISRAELRDFYDAYVLLQRGYAFDTALELAKRIDGAMSHETLAYVLCEIEWDAFQATAEREGYSDISAMTDYFREMAEDLALRILPKDPPT